MGSGVESVLALLFAVFAMYVSSFEDERILYKPRECVDCQGYTVSDGEYYFDGCNVCYCYGQNTSTCTDKWCKWNKCYQIEKEENEEGGENGDNGRNFHRNADRYLPGK